MRNCDCAGGCGPRDENDGFIDELNDGLNDGLTRREFLALAGAGTASLILIKPGMAQGVSAQGVSAQTPALQAPAAEFEQWQKALREAAAPRVYVSDTHRDARMHLGGI